MVGRWYLGGGGAVPRGASYFGGPSQTAAHFFVFFHLFPIGNGVCRFWLGPKSLSGYSEKAFSIFFINTENNLVTW